LLNLPRNLFDQFSPEILKTMADLPWSGSKKNFDFFCPPLDSFFEIHYFLSLSSFFSGVGFLCSDVCAFQEGDAGGYQF
jgi:hypothetical protein